MLGSSLVDDSVVNCKQIFVTYSPDKVRKVM